VSFYCAMLVVGCILHTLPAGNTVYGVTTLDNMIYMLRSKASQHISVYDADTYRLERKIIVPGLDALSDIAACPYYRCLYIAGGDDERVYRVALWDDNDVTNWPVYDVLACLSVTDTHSVLVTCDEVRKIKEFNTAGKLLRQIQLPRDVVSPWHTIQLSSGEFVVCHGRASDPLHRVCLIGSDGRVVKSYGGPPGSGTQQMNAPVHLAVDMNGFVFVADLNNDRVLLLSPALTFVREALSREQLKWSPQRLWYDCDRRRLYVAVNEWNDGKHTAGRVVVVSV